MASLRTFPLDVPTAVAAGTAFQVDNVTDIGVYVLGTFVATLQLQVSPDGTTWYCTVHDTTA